MSKRSCAVLLFGLVLAAAVPGRADDAAPLRALVEQSIQAHGGEAALAKFRAGSVKLKGTAHAMGLAIPFTGEVLTQGSDQLRVAIDVEVNGQKFSFVSVLNRDKGWIRMNDQTREMDRELVAEAQAQAYVGWVSSLLPLKDKSFQLSPLGEVKIDDKPAVGVRVTRKGSRDVSLYFDKKTHLLVKTESVVKDETTGMEVTQETFFSDYKEVEGSKQAATLTIKRDGKRHLEAEVFDYKIFDKLDDSVFAKP
jgi:hypothetical protein